MSDLPIIAPDGSILREAACRALGEDLGPADITSMAVIPAEARARGRVIARQNGVAAGMPLAVEVLRQTDTAIRWQIEVKDGDTFNPGQCLMRIDGPARSLLSAERVLLNFLQHLCGIATITAQFVAQTHGTRCRILDTRKTTPGLRHLQKYAVRCGGGTNHRIGLYDAFMIKDNHIALSGDIEGIAEAVCRARHFDPDADLTVEADTLEQVEAAIAAGAPRILLDNMETATLRRAVEINAGRAILEASGNMTLDRIAEVAATGVDFISVGALTHSAPCLDISLELLPG